MDTTMTDGSSDGRATDLGNMVLETVSKLSKFCVDSQVRTEDTVKKLCAIKSADKNGCEEFTGVSSSVPVRRWFRLLEDNFELTGVAKANWLLATKVKLRGDARSAAGRAEKLYGAGLTYDTLKKELIGEYEPTDYLDKLRRTLRSMRQDKSLSRYIASFLDILMELPDRPELDNVFDFKEGLKPRVRAHVSLGKPKNLVEAVHMAREFEGLGFGARGLVDEETLLPAGEPMEIYSVKRNEIRCHECGEVGHKRAQCSKSRSGTRVDAYRGSRKEITCWNCGGVGHVKNVCPSRISDESPRYVRSSIWKSGKALTVNGWIKGHKLDFVVDSGADVSVLSKSCVDKLGVKVYPVGKDSALKTLGGQCAVLGETERIELMVQNESVGLNVLVVDDGKVNLLGCDWLEKTKAVICFAEGKILVPRKEALVGEIEESKYHVRAAGVDVSAMSPGDIKTDCEGIETDCKSTSASEEEDGACKQRRSEGRGSESEVQMPDPDGRLMPNSCKAEFLMEWGDVSSIDGVNPTSQNPG